MSENRIEQALTKLFERDRIIFWYDAKHELRPDFWSVELPDVEKIELSRNEFAVKHRILREQPEQKFLLYHDGPQPPDLDNWLLDVLLAHKDFRTDQAALWLSELDLGPEFVDVIQAHVEFFRAAKRKDALKNLLKPGDTTGAIKLKMLAVCAGSDPRLDAVVESLLAELADHKDEKIKIIAQSRLDQFLWEQMARCYGYQSDAPGIKDFILELFKSCYAMGTGGQIKMNGDALVFLKRWKDSIKFKSCFESLSEECAADLGIEQDLDKRDFRDLLELDYFRLIDQKIICELVRCVTAKTVSSDNVTIWVRQRRQSHWYGEYASLYEAIDVAAEFIRKLDEATLEMTSLSDGVQCYRQSWFRLDQLYRKFIYHVRKSGQTSMMGDIAGQIENLYVNNYLLKVNNRWQAIVDTAARWEAAPILSQNEFFEKWVKPFPDKDNKVYVIISDALRYEIGDELLKLIRQEDRYDATLEPVLSMLPSYTQLGMAALLPNRQLALADNDTGTVMVDGQSSQGMVNREKILQAGLPGKQARTMSANDFLAMPREGDDGYRTLFRDNDVVYIYHNRIDSIGDKRDSEESVFEAAQDAIEELLKIIRKISNANASNMLVTADHGFIYQNRVLDESDFSSGDATGGQILFRDRRFVLGKGLADSASLRKFTPEQLGLAGDVEVQIPKSINRLRLKGSGSRYVHGGASLQEVVIPVLIINKKRQSDTSVVDVDILTGSSSVITSGQLAAAFYQARPVTDKLQPRILQAGIYTLAGELISDSHNLTFDLTSENPRTRELQVRFVLTRKADAVNGQEVLLKLTEKVAGTTHFKEYKSVRYMMRRSFTSDFDF